MRLILMALVLYAQEVALAQDAPSSQSTPTPSGQARFEALIAEIQDLQKRHTVTVHGADNPSAISRGVRLQMFFAPFRMIDDDLSFAQFALERVGATGSDVEALKNVRNISPVELNSDTCALLLDGSLASAGGLDIANHVIAVEEEWNNKIVARFQLVIDRLSPRVRENVLRGVNEAAAGMVSTNLDHIGMATEDPDLYKTMTTGLCRGHRHATASGPAPSSRDSNNSNQTRQRR